MDIGQILTRLGDWTPFLAGGFALNLLISVVSMTLGTLLGAGLGLTRARDGGPARAGARAATMAFRNIPSFVFMYYIAFMTPVEFEWNGELHFFPAWIKAAVALTIPVIGFSSDQVLKLRQDAAAGRDHPFGAFAVSWTQYLLIIIMASSTASVIGVDEIVGRANTAIAAMREPAVMIWMYGYVALWFLGAGAIVGQSLKWARARLDDKRTHMRMEE